MDVSHIIFTTILRVASYFFHLFPFNWSRGVIQEAQHLHRLLVALGLATVFEVSRDLSALELPAGDVPRTANPTQRPAEIGFNGAFKTKKKGWHLVCLPLQTVFGQKYIQPSKRHFILIAWVTGTFLDLRFLAGMPGKDSHQLVVRVNPAGVLSVFRGNHPIILSHKQIITRWNGWSGHSNSPTPKAISRCPVDVDPLQVHPRWLRDGVWRRWWSHMVDYPCFVETYVGTTNNSDKCVFRDSCLLCTVYLSVV